ncbi:HEPN domain-containing protein [Gordonia sihwensis]|uniref:ApeA N-terminal domain 1-containing protein n=1 Tax=Gordonia sihwensis TaxID=173559 RepID=UPI003D96B8E6
MDDVRRYRGLWWIGPADGNSAAEKVGGVLTIDGAGRARLEVMSALVDRSLTADGTARRSLRSFDETRTIYGAAEGKAITLLGCTQANGGQISVLPVPTETQVFRADAAVIGCWLGDADAAEFSGTRVEISHLTEWSCRSGLSWELTTGHPDDRQDASAQGDTVHSIELRTVPTVEVPLPDEGFTVALLSAQSLGPGGKENAWGRTHQVRERTVFEVRMPEPRQALGFQDALRPMQNLLTLATQSACAVAERRLIWAADSSGRETAGLYFHGEDVEIEATRDHHQMLFTLDEFGGPSAIERWYRLSRRIGPPMNVLFGLDYETGGYYETRLFTVATVVEGFHAALCPASTAIDPDDHSQIRRRVKAALKGADPHMREWALNTLGPNRSGLSKRCAELAALADPTAVEKLLGDTGVWAKWLVNARNSVGHGRLVDPQDAQMPEEAFYRLADITKHLIHLVLMAQLGLSAVLQQRAVDQHWGYQARRFREAVADRKP